MDGKEIWKDVNGFEGFYQVSNFGRLRSIDRIITTKAGWTQRNYGKIIKTENVINSGYIKVDLHKNGKSYPKLLHRLVAESFCEKPEGCDYVNHRDMNKTNNTSSNLEWCTAKYNNQYGE